MADPMLSSVIANPDIPDVVIEQGASHIDLQSTSETISTAQIFPSYECFVIAGDVINLYESFQSPIPPISSIDEDQGFELSLSPAPIVQVDSIPSPQVLAEVDQHESGSKGRGRPRNKDPHPLDGIAWYASQKSNFATKVEKVHSEWRLEQLEGKYNGSLETLYLENGIKEVETLRNRSRSKSRNARTKKDIAEREERRKQQVRDNSKRQTVYKHQRQDIVDAKINILLLRVQPLDVEQEKEMRKMIEKEEVKNFIKRREKRKKLGTNVSIVTR